MLIAGGVSPELHGQGRAQTQAVPELIVLTEAERGSPTGAELARAQEAFRTSLGEDPARATRIAKDIVALAREAFGDSHDHTARALTNLAIVQAANTDFEAAVENFTAAVRTRERASGTIVSADLVNPLRGLGGAYLSLDDIDRAVPILERAIHISHVNEGPENLDQVEILDALSRAHYFNGDLDTADDLQDAVFRLRERASDDNRDLYFDALEQRATWYRRVGRIGEAIRFRRRLVRAISDEYGDDDPRLIEPLLTLADAAGAYPDRWGGPVSGRRALKRAVRIARAHADENPVRLAMTLIDEGDWFTARFEARDARLSYQEAWQILSENPELHGVRDELLAEPERILRSQLRGYYGVREGAPVLRPDLFTEEGYVVVTFDLDAAGKPRNVRVADASPPGIMDLHVRYQVRQFRYRPAFEDGRPRAFEGLSYRHTFRYDESALTDRDRKRIATTTYETDP